MKRFFLFTALCISGLYLQAQVVYNRPDFAHVGDEIPVAIYSNTDGETGMDMSAFGTEDNMLFSNFTFEQCIYDTMRFKPSSEYDPAGTFPGATLAFINENGFTVFLKISWDDARVIGMMGEIPMVGGQASLKSTDSLTVMEFPCSATHEFEDNGSFEQKMPISAFHDIIPADYYQIVASMYDTIKFQVNLYQNSSFDYNTAITIDDTISYNATREVIREMREEIQMTNVFIRSTFGAYYQLDEAPLIGDQIPIELPMLDSTYSINFWAYSLGIPVVSIQVTPDRQTAKTVRLYNGESLAINPVQNMSWSVFPNPANDVVTFRSNSSQPSNIKIYSVDGKIVLNDDFCSDIYIFDALKIPQGLYLYQISNNSDSVVETGRLEVIR
ncbi:MAG TPA: T9SS type A sorting domain-containing protein [Bacteroidales bacterium]|nr:T9SS type A sorting domain-containing protein [Bacteroidales bacterium]HQL69489.1 T9SS type A sorting domain-containing protein [Bacteroidales bacterium]